MKRIIVVVLVAIAAISSCSFVKAGESIKVQGSGNITTVKYNVPDFNKVSVAIGSDVEYIITDGQPYVSVTADDNAQEYLKFSVKGNELQIKPTKGNVAFNNCKIKILVASSSLNCIEIAGSSDFEVKCPLKSENFKCSIAGSGDVDIDGLETGSASFDIAGSGDIDIEKLNCEELKCSIAGSGDIEVSGYAKNAKYSIAGSGDIDATGLKADHSDTSVAGSGKVRN